MDRSSVNVGLYQHYIEVYSLHWAIALEAVAVSDIPGGPWLPVLRGRCRNWSDLGQPLWLHRGVWCEPCPEHPSAVVGAAQNLLLE